MNNDSIALEIIQEWNSRDYKNEGQKAASLQVLIISALDKKDDTLKRKLKPKPLTEAMAKITYRIFEHWKTTMKHPRSVLDSKRRRLISLRLRDGYTEADLCQAITGCSLTPHNMGQNDRSERYDSIELILRNAGQIDRFMGNATNPNIGKANGTSRQNSSEIFSQGCSAAFEPEEDEKPPH